MFTNRKAHLGIIDEPIVARAKTSNLTKLKQSKKNTKNHSKSKRSNASTDGEINDTNTETHKQNKSPKIKSESKNATTVPSYVASHRSHQQLVRVVTQDVCTYMKTLMEEEVGDWLRDERLLVEVRREPLQKSVQ